MIPEPSISSKSYSYQKTELIESKISVSNYEPMISLDDPESTNDYSKEKNVEQIPISITLDAAEKDENVDKPMYEEIGEQDQQNKNTKFDMIRSPTKVHNLSYTEMYHRFRYF